MNVDLHIHTTASDGAWSPAEVVRGASDGGLDLIAITDHDSTAGFAEAVSVGRRLRVQVVPGIEVSSTHEHRDVHILGYFVDSEAPALVAHSERAVTRRVERMHEMVDRLDSEGVDVTYDDVLAAAGPDAVAIGRPHLARALVERGHVGSVPQAFASLIGDRSPAYVPTHLLTPVAAIELVTDAGGVPVWAHPPADMIDALLPTLVRNGLEGLEVYRPSHRHHDVLRLEKICRSAGLIASGGSDWHTPDAGSALGDFRVDAREVEALLSIGGF